MTDYQHLPALAQYLLWGNIIAAGLLAYIFLNYSDGHIERPLLAAGLLGGSSYLLFVGGNWRLLAAIALTIWAYRVVWRLWSGRSRWIMKPEHMTNYVPPEGRHIAVSRGDVVGRTKNNRFLLLKDGNYLFTNKAIQPGQERIDGLMFTWDQLVKDRDRYADHGWHGENRWTIGRYIGIYHGGLNAAYKTQSSTFKAFYSFLPDAPPQQQQAPRPVTDHQKFNVGNRRRNLK